MKQPVVHSESRRGVAVLTIDNPPVNAIDQRVRVGLLDAIVTADGDPATGAIVVRGAGRHFAAGAAIEEFDTGPEPPLLNDVLLRVESCGKPVIAALHGLVLGGGLELALACHYRCSGADASLGFPEIRLGLMPGSGGTQRLPRLVGERAALAMMLDGEPVEAARAIEIGLVDRVVSGADVLEAAIAWARELMAAGRGPVGTRDREVPGDPVGSDWLNEMRSAARQRFRGVESVEAIIECVQAASIQPFDTALAWSRQRFEACRQSVPSRALRHLFFAEHSTRIAQEPRAVRTVGVIGAGTMGTGIAISLATAGYGVVLLDTKPEAVAAGLERVRQAIGSQVAKRRLSQRAADDAIARAQGSDEFDSLHDADLVIEAVYENLAAKQDVFRRIGRLCRPGTVLATNTSTLDVDAIAAASGRSQDVVGMHFFSPANVMRLVEVVRGSGTVPDVLATALAVSRRMGKLGIVVGNCFGFVGNRMLYGYGRENQLLLLEGAGPAQVDAVLERFGMAIGPNAVGDLAGLDVGYSARRERKDSPTDPRYYRVADMLVEAGRLGQKSGRGAFLYPSGTRKPVRDPEVEAMIAAEAARLGIVQREVHDREILERCLYALINEGARVLGEGIAATPRDIDAIWCNGYGFPRYRGGPMFHAETIGLDAVLAGVKRFAATLGPTYWTPAPLLVELATRGDTFNAWHCRRALGRE
jgi:3-hydroxyacyl-CoA dehydrogenase